MFKIFSYHGDFSDANHFMICYDDILSYCTHLYVEIRRLASIILCTFTKIYIYDSERYENVCSYTHVFTRKLLVAIQESTDKIY